MTFRGVRISGGRLAPRRRGAGGRLDSTARFSLIALTALILAGVVGPLGHAAAALRGEGVHTLTGTATIENPWVIDSRTDPYVLLHDLTEFFGNPRNATPVGQQVLAGLEGDIADEATYTLSLPIAPKGGLLNVGDGEGDDDGVQVYRLQVISDALGDPFFSPLDWSGATPAASLQYDTATERWAGMLVVWAPDDERSFPEGLGEDGMLFSGDEAVVPLDAGWTVVDLSDETFDFERDGTAEVPLIEAEGVHTDLSDLDYVESFDVLVDDLRVRYAFKDHKEIDFDAMVEEVRPLVVAAERDEDPAAYAAAMMRFASLFGDGHVSVDLRHEQFDDYLTERYGGSPGLTLGETDAGEVIVVSVTTGSPAAEAGIESGAEILRWNHDPIAEALDDVEPMRGQSSPHTLGAHQLLMLPRTAVGDEVTITLRNPGARGSETVELEVTADPVGLEEVRGLRRPNARQLPVMFEVLPSGIGYIKVNTFHDEVSLLYDSWEWALNRLEALEIEALIVDVRGNGGGIGDISTYFAGTFVDDRFVLARDFSADENGEFQRAGAMVVEPSPIRWEKPVAVLIDARCGSACEIFTAAVAEGSDAIIVGHTPTAGVEAGVLPWTLPEEIPFQASIYLMLDQEGEVFLEGVGVPPTVDVPVTADSLLSPDDEVQLAAESALLDEIGDHTR